MLQQVCENIHNYFVREKYADTYTIADGMISPVPPLKEGQRFWLVGSDLNDGVYTYHAEALKNDDDDGAAGLSDEVFAGTICAMAVPPAVIALVGEIGDWESKYGAVVASPYSSENVTGVYNYSKTTKSEEGGGGGLTWRDIYAAQLKRWRKISI